MNNDEIRQKAIKAGKEVLASTIVIKTNIDLTPKGKRSARVVRSRKSKKLPFPVIALYVGGAFYIHSIDSTMANEWVAA